MTLDGLCQLEDDGFGPEVTVIEAAGSDGHRQALCVRIGPVFSGSDEESAPGIWVEYQPKYQASAVLGPVLLTAATWNDLDRAVKRRLRRWKYCRLVAHWYRLIHPSEW